MTLSREPDLPTIDDVRAAADRLAGHAVTTPLLESPLLNDRVGGRVLVKAEVLQKTGSFKFRGAFNCLASLPEDVRRNGVVAFSSGNHAQGVAAAAAHFGVPAVIVMPGDAPAIKIERTRAFGAEVRLYDRDTEDREAIGEELASTRGATLVRPFDDPRVIAGQGTVGLEIAAQAKTAGAVCDAVLIPCSGGGLTAGCALALAAESPGTRVHTVEPAGFDDTARSLAAGRRLENAPGAATACDALVVQTPGVLTFAINSRLTGPGLTVDDPTVERAMATAFADLKIVVEPSGAIALAALLGGQFDCRDKTVAVVCSGGNADPKRFARALQAHG